MGLRISFNKEEYARKYYQKNKERIKLQHREWYLCNKEKVEERTKEWKRNNPHKAKEYWSKPKSIQRRKKYRQRPEVKERARARQLSTKYKKWLKAYLIKPEVRERRRLQRQSIKHKNTQKAYLKKNQLNWKKYQNEWHKKKRIDSYEYRVSEAISAGIRGSLKSGKNGRHWEKIVGYVLKDLIKHLENLFDKNMNWDNYGNYWSIDHIKPQSLFNFTSTEEQSFKDCWALDNLQPLEKITNIRKGNRFIG